MNEHRNHRFRIATLATVGILLIGPIVALWSWNTVAVDVFDTPAIQYKHALAMELLVITVSATIGLARTLVHGRPRPVSETA